MEIERKKKLSKQPDDSFGTVFTLEAQRTRASSKHTDKSMLFAYSFAKGKKYHIFFKFIFVAVSICLQNNCTNRLYLHRNTENIKCVRTCNVSGCKWPIIGRLSARRTRSDGFDGPGPSKRFSFTYISLAKHFGFATVNPSSLLRGLHAIF